MEIDVVDVSCAYLHAKAKRDVYIELPDEDKTPGTCGKLDMSLYGTRDAAQNWEDTYSEIMTDLGFTRGKASPCIFHHSAREVTTVIHGDDFTTLATEDNLKWLEANLRKRLEIKMRGILGPDRNDMKQITVLNRVVTWENNWITYEADQRRSEMLVNEL